MRPVILVALLAASCIHIAPHPIAPADTAAALGNRSLDDPQLRAFLDQHGAAGDTWDLQHLTIAALYFHPDLDVARAHAAVTRAAIATAGERPNPTVNANVEHKAEPHTNPWITMLGFDATIETANKRGLRVREASDAARAADFAVADQAWRVRSGVRAQLVAFSAASRSGEALQRQHALNEEILDMLDKRVAAGEASTPEVTQARVASRQTALLIRDRASQAAQARARLATAIGIPERALHETTFDIAALPDVAISDEARVTALTTRPDILGALADYAVSESALRLELAKQYPDLHVSPGFGWDQSFARWALGFSATAPVLSHNRGPIREAEARRHESEAKLIQVQARVIGALDEATARFRAAIEKVHETDSVIALDRQRVAQSQRSFDAGESDRLALRTTQLELESAIVAHTDALGEAQAALGALEDAVQQELK
jgi:outer membrane protein, heavy metal efflux system